MREREIDSSGAALVLIKRLWFPLVAWLIKNPLVSSSSLALFCFFQKRGRIGVVIVWLTFLFCYLHFQLGNK